MGRVFSFLIMRPRDFNKFSLAIRGNLITNFPLDMVLLIIIYIFLLDIEAAEWPFGLKPNALLTELSVISLWILVLLTSPSLHSFLYNTNKSTKFCTREVSNNSIVIQEWHTTLERNVWIPATWIINSFEKSFQKLPSHCPQSFTFLKYKLKANIYTIYYVIIYLLEKPFQKRLFRVLLGFHKHSKTIKSTRPTVSCFQNVSRDDDDKRSRILQWNHCK